MPRRPLTSTLIAIDPRERMEGVFLNRSNLSRLGHLSIALIAGTSLGLSSAPARAIAQSDDPAPALAASEGAKLPDSKTDAKADPKPEETTILGFKNVTVDQVVPFLVEATGKVVIPTADVMSRRITILNDQPIPRRRAYELVVFALQQAGVAVMETPSIVTLRALEEIDRQDVPVLGPDVNLSARTDIGSIVEKVFALRHASATNIGEQLKPTLPAFAKLFVDADSNQIVVMGNVGLLQRVESLITSLDTPAAAGLVSETFVLKFADADQIATNIKDLYSASSTSNNANNRNQNQNPFQQFFGRGQQGGGGGGGGGGGNGQRGQGAGSGGQNSRGSGGEALTSQNLRVTANTRLNSVTVLAERQIIEQVRTQIAEAWDRPISESATVPRIYQLKNSDPVKVRDLLNTLFGTGQASTASTTGGQGSSASTGTQQGAGRLLGQFSFEAVPDSGRIVAVSKSPENFAVIDKIIEDLDKPQTAGLPQIVELKHANAEELAEQLNALLSQEGTLAQITKSETGLATSSSSTSPFATNANANSSNTGTTNTNTQNQNQTTPGTITFWWQRARTPTNSSGSSNLVSKIRIVPVWRQNALMVIAPPEYQNTLVSVIEQMDRPGRQVLLSAVIAEISIDDTLNLGLRFASQAITPGNADNSFSLTQNGNIQTFTGTKTDLLPGLFNNSVLNVGMNVNVLLQALAQKTKINILSEPRIFTSDNQQAEFFSGQDIPFITNSQTNAQNNNIVQSFDYRAVGIALRVRPRITMNRDIDLSINLELSSIRDNQTLFGGFVVDRRETTTHLIVENGQTVVVSGIIRTEDQDVQRKVPLLGDIPFAGELFKSTEKTKTKTELVAFITPYVVNSTQETSKLNESDREHLGELREQLRPADELDKKQSKPSEKEWVKGSPKNANAKNGDSKSDTPANTNEVEKSKERVNNWYE